MLCSLDVGADGERLVAADGQNLALQLGTGTFLEGKES